MFPKLGFPTHVQQQSPGETALNPLKSYMAALHNPTYLLKNMKQIPKHKNPYLPKSIVLKLFTM